MILGINLDEKNRAFICNGKINERTNFRSEELEVMIGTEKWNFQWPDKDVLRRDVALHEVLHSFNIGDVIPGSNSDFDIMAYGYASTGKIKCWRENNNGQDETKELTFNLDTYPVIGVQNIRKVQETLVPR